MRRRTLIGGVVAAGAAVAAGLYRFTDLFVKHYPPTPYDDVLMQLVDRQQAIKVGKSLRRFTDVVDPDEDAKLAREIRQRLSGASLKDVSEKEILTGQLIEVDGWLLPLTLVMTCVLAAHATPDKPA